MAQYLDAGVPGRAESTKAGSGGVQPGGSALDRALDNHEAWLATQGESGSRLEVSDSLLSGKTVKGRDLRGALFSGARLRMTVFEDCIMDRVAFENIDADMITFRKTSLEEASFSGHSRVNDCSIEGGSMAGALMFSTKMDKLSISDASVEGMMMNGVEAPSFSMRRVSGNLSMEDVTAPGMSIKDSEIVLDAKNVSAPRSRIADTSIYGKIFDVNLDRSRLDRVDSRGMSMVNVSALHVDIDRWDISGGRIDGMSLAHSGIDDLKLDRAWMDRLDFKGADLGATYFNESRMARVSFSTADMRGVRGSPASVGMVDVAAAERVPAAFSSALVSAPVEAETGSSDNFVHLFVDPRTRKRFELARGQKQAEPASTPDAVKSVSKRVEDVSIPNESEQFKPVRMSMPIVSSSRPKKRFDYDNAR